MNYYTDESKTLLKGTVPLIDVVLTIQEDIADKQLYSCRCNYFIEMSSCFQIDTKINKTFFISAASEEDRAEW